MVKGQTEVSRQRIDQIDQRKNETLHAEMARIIRVIQPEAVNQFRMLEKTDVSVVIVRD